MTLPTELARIVSRETTDKLQIFHDHLLRWTARINLISPATRTEIWSRHIADCLQIWPHAPESARTWIDLGAGAGLPGLVIAIVAAEASPELCVTLVESDTRKAAFLRHCAAELDLNARVIADRIERIPPLPQDVISARALAPLPRLLELSGRFRHDRTIHLLLKGRSALSELTAARRDWHIEAEAIPSLTERDGVLLKIVEVGPRT